MEQQVGNALERIENPILIILIAVLLIAVGWLSIWVRSLQQKLLDTLLENVAAVTNINTNLGGMNAGLTSVNARLEAIENKLSNLS